MTSHGQVDVNSAAGVEKKGVREKILLGLLVLEWHEFFFASDYHSVVAATLVLALG